MNISPSAMKMLPEFGSCNRKLYYKVHTNVKKNKTDEVKKNIGTITHALIEQYLRSLQYGYIFDEKQKLANVLSKHIEIKLMQQEIEKVLIYFHTAKEHINTLKDFRLYCDPEVTFLYPYKSSIDDKIYMIKGIIDIIFIATINGEAHLCIGDFKTGKSSYENKQGIPQMTTYAYLYKKLYEAHQHAYLPTKAVYFFLQENKIAMIDMDEEYDKNTEIYIDSYIKASYDDNLDNYPRKRSGLCNKYCDYSKDCINIVMGKQAK